MFNKVDQSDVTKLITRCKGESAILSVKLLVYLITTVSGLVLGKNLVGADT